MLWSLSSANLKLSKKLFSLHTVTHQTQYKNLCPLFTQLDLGAWLWDFIGLSFPLFLQVAPSPTPHFTFHLPFPKPLIFLVFTPSYIDNHHEFKPCFQPNLLIKFVQNTITTGHWLSINFAVFHTTILEQGVDNWKPIWYNINSDDNYTLCFKAAFI